jgi:type II secretory pathway component PulC
VKEKIKTLIQNIREKTVSRSREPSKIRARLQVFGDQALKKALPYLEKLPQGWELLHSSRKLKYPALFLLGFLSADIALQAVANYLLAPSSKGGKASAPVRVIQEPAYLNGLKNYEDSLIAKNAFCPGCPVPGFTDLRNSRPKDCGRAKASKGSSIKVIGTIVLSVPEYSVATISDGGAETMAIKKGDNVARMGKVFEIRRNRICFEDQDGLLQFVDVPEETFKFGQPLATAMPASPLEGVSRVSDTEFEIKKSFLVEKISDPNTLFQAHAVPFKDQNGNISGFKVLSVVPGSPFEALGVQAEDVIVGVDGDPLDSLAKAQELYAALNTKSEIVIEFLRNGQSVKQTFKIK